jgi:hypothetical protein
LGHPHWVVQVPRLRRCNAYTYSHSHSHRYTYGNSYSDSHVYSDRYGDLYAYCHCDIHAYGYSCVYTYGDGDLCTDSNGYVYAYGDSHVYSDRYGDLYAYCHCDIHTYGYSYVYTYGNGDLYTDSYGYVYAYCHCDIHTYGDCNSNCNRYGNRYRYSNRYRYRHRYSDANTNTSCADGIERYQPDYQQLYCELDQCQRCDRLPVGRVYEQCLWHGHLRAGVPGSECRKLHYQNCNRLVSEHILLLPGARCERGWHQPQFQRHQGKDQTPLR